VNLDKDSVHEIVLNLFNILSQKEKVDQKIMIISCELLTTLSLSQDHYVELFKKFRSLFNSHEYLHLIISNFILHSYSINFDSKHQVFPLFY
jgi:hypothetical protein